jgi:hypothetical protein
MVFDIYHLQNRLCARALFYMHQLWVKPLILVLSSQTPFYTPPNHHEPCSGREAPIMTKVIEGALHKSSLHTYESQYMQA